MVCYAVPAVAALVHYGLRKTKTSWKKSTSQLWLSLLLSGGAIFGIVDHLWKGELFLFGENLLLDLLLGVTITVAILIAWFIAVILNKTSIKKTTKTIRLIGIFSLFLPLPLFYNFRNTLMYSD